MARNSFAGGISRSNVAKTSGQVSVATSTTSVVAANNTRAELTITNDGANVVYLMLNTTDGTTVPTAVANQGIRLAATGGSWTTNSYTGPVAGIALTGATVVTVVEV
jgi:hypothetical protein